MRVDKGLAPMAVVAFGILVLCVLDTFMKALLAEHSTIYVVTLRYLSGASWAVLFFLIFGRSKPSWRSMRANLMRAFVVVFTAFSFFYAIARLPFAEAIAITFTSPIFIALLGRAILGEKIGGNIVLAVTLGSAGVLVILSGRVSPESLEWRYMDGVVAALLSAVSYALATVLMRKQTAHDPMLTIVMLQNVFATAISLPIGLAHWTPPSQHDILLAAGAGLFGTIGHCAMAWGYARAEAARLGALEYTSFIWAALLGWAFFNETPTPVVFVGALLIIAGAIAASWRMRGKRATPAAVEEV